MTPERKPMTEAEALDALARERKRRELREREQRRFDLARLDERTMKVEAR
jgi:hypothetical protein